MLSTNQNADYINVHSKRKKENLITFDQTSPTKKYKISFNESDLPSTTTTNNNNINNKRPIPANLEQWLMMFHQWTNNERIIALDSLVTSEICEIQQMRHLLSIIEPQLQRDFISLLPKELSLYVLSFLDPPDLLRAAQTCRYWRILCEDNLLWREKCREEGLLDDHETLSDLFASRISSTANTPTTLIGQPSKILGNKSPTTSLRINSSSEYHNNPIQQNTAVAECSEYKLAYLHHKNIEYNWRYGILNYNSNNNDDDNGEHSSIALNLSNQPNHQARENNNSIPIDNVQPPLCANNN
ncbi:hypothetical protein BLA29_005548, partial [Euroglyphus maynei]